MQVVCSRRHLFRVITRIEYCYWDPALPRALHHCHSRLLVNRREHDSGHASVDHRIHNFDLAARVDLKWRRVPVHCVAELAGRFDRARMHPLPEYVTDALGHAAKHTLSSTAAGRTALDM